MRITLRVEAGSAILYHATYKGRAANIVKSNRFELKPAEGTAAEEAVAKATYYLSTTRNKLGAYTRLKLSPHAAIIVLDGSRLGMTYRIAPADYWGIHAIVGQRNKADADEAEERVFSKKATMPSRRYIIEIHAHVGESGDKSRAEAIRLKKECLIAKIPVFFYADMKSLLLMDKRKSISLDIKEKVQEEEPYQYSREYRMAQYADRRHNFIRGWIELALMPVGTKSRDEIYEMSKGLSKYAKMAYKQLGYNYNGDPLRSLQADLHNAKSMAYGRINGERESLDKFIAMLRGRKQSVKEFVDSLYDKWYPKQPAQ